MISEIFFFKGNNLIGQDDIVTECKHCQRSTGHTLFIFQHSKKIIGIPSFPLNKEGKLKCGQCGLSRREYDFTQIERLMLESFKEDVKAPWWMYSGFPVLILIIGIPVAISLLLREPVQTGPGLIGKTYCLQYEDTVHVIRGIHQNEDTIWFQLKYKVSTTGKTVFYDIAESIDTIPVLRTSFLKAVENGDIYSY